MPVIILASLLFSLTAACGLQQKDSAAGGDSWTDGKTDLSGLGVSFTAPFDLEARSGSGTSMNWVAATGDVSLTVSYEVALTSDSLSQWVTDTITLSDGVVVTEQGPATGVVGRTGASQQRLYSGQASDGKTATAVVAAIPRDSVDRTGFGGVRVLGVSTTGGVESLKKRVSDLASSIQFSAMQPQTQVRQYLAVGEWSFTGPVNSGEPSGTIGKQLVWLCTGKLAFKQIGYPANSVLDAADSKLLTGTWEAYSGVGQPLLYIRIDGDQVAKLFPISLQTESKAFTWGGKQFLGTDRGCELGLPEQLYS